MDILNIGTEYIFSFPRLLVENSLSPNLFYNPKSYDPATLIYVLSSLSILVFIAFVVVYKYNRWKKYNNFLSEMKSLDLDPSSEGTFAWMVKRHQMNEPTEIIFSQKIFDEMAADEMKRVLSSPGTKSAKQQFIDTVYEIRNRTFGADRFISDESAT
jgi:hypothetical protein